MPSLLKILNGLKRVFVFVQILISTTFYIVMLIKAIWNDAQKYLNKHRIFPSLYLTFLSLCTVPCSFETCPYHFSLVFFTGLKVFIFFNVAIINSESIARLFQLSLTEGNIFNITNYFHHLRMPSYIPPCLRTIYY